MSLPVSRLSVFFIIGMFSFINIFVFYNYVNRKQLLKMPIFPHPTTNKQSTLDDNNRTIHHRGAVTSSTVRPVINMFRSPDYTIKTAKNCSGSNPSTRFTVICVCTAVKNFKTREAIRETWGSQLSVDNTTSIVLLFFVGRTSVTREQAKLENESLAHDDIVQTDFDDSYRNLTLKSVSMLRWVSDHCPNATYVVKVDDDCFLNIPFLFKELKKAGKRRKLLIGYLLRHVRPVRDVKSKYHVSAADYRPKIYPTYVSGSCYVMTGDVTVDMYATCRSLPFMPMEDIFVTGICAKKIGVLPTHNTHFVHWKLPSNGCDYQDKIMGHWVKTDDFRKVWQDMLKLKKKTYKCVLRPRAVSKSKRPRK